MNSLDPSPSGKRDTRWVTGLAGAYLVLLYVAACAILSVFGYVRRQQIPGVRNYFPSSVPTPTASPHILVHPPPDSVRVMDDNFDSNAFGWSANYPFSKVQVVNGRLLLESNRPGYFAIARIKNEARLLSDGKYYLQADFATDVSTVYPYGLVFGLDTTADAYYSFEVFPQTRGYSLTSYSGGTRQDLVPYKFAAVKPYPQSNTLSVYYDHGNIELYINGSLLTTYLDPAPHENGAFGVEVADSGFTLSVDNFFAYNDK